ncbi:MAG: hypothetical protein GY853_13690 [PVC group bacterium]|nr:hypothetical protein [PVC group bacterium]
MKTTTELIRTPINTRARIIYLAKRLRRYSREILLDRITSQHVHNIEKRMPGYHTKEILADIVLMETMEY